MTWIRKCQTNHFVILFSVTFSSILKAIPFHLKNIAWRIARFDLLAKLNGTGYIIEQLFVAIWLNLQKCLICVLHLCSENLPIRNGSNVSSFLMTVTRSLKVKRKRIPTNLNQNQLSQERVCTLFRYLHGLLTLQITILSNCTIQVFNCAIQFIKVLIHSIRWLTQHLHVPFCHLPN